MSIGRHTALNMAGAIVPFAISLITIPIYLKLIGEERYGVLAIVWLILGYFGVFDLGLGRATAQRIGSLRSGTVGDRAKVFWSALVVNLGLGALAGMIILPVSYYVFGSVIGLDAEMRTEMLGTLPWLALIMPLATLSGVLSGALVGRERFLELNVIAILGAAMFQILPLIAVYLLGADLRVIIPAVLLARAVTMSALFNRCLHHVCPGQGINFKKTEALRLLKFGGWVTVSSLISPMMVILDRMIIGIMSGAAAVTLYTVPFQLADRTTIPARAISGAMFPRFSGQEKTERASLAHEGQRAIISLMTPITVIGILLIEPFLSLWISPSFGQNASTVGIIILVGFWANCLAFVPFASIQASGRPDLVAKCHLAEVLPYFVLLYVGLTYFGIVGAALAFSIRVAADTLLLCWFAGQLHATIRGIMIPAMIISSATMIALFLQPFSLFWIIAAAAILVFSLFWAWVSAPAKVRERLSPIIAHIY